MKSWFSPDTGLALFHGVLCVTDTLAQRLTQRESLVYDVEAGLSHPARATVEAEDPAMVRFW